MTTPTPWAGAPWTPREWQCRALEPSLRAVDDGEAGIVCAVTGSGKSVFLAELAHQMRARGDGPVVITTPTQNLVRQLAATVTSRCGAFEVGQFYQHNKQADRPIVVTCHPSLDAYLEAADRPPAYWIADEAHKTEAETFVVSARQALEKTRRIGLTATPFRASDEDRLRLWDRVVFRYSPGEALKDGVIVPWRVESWEGSDQVSIDDAVEEMIKAHAVGPGVVNAISVADATSYAERLTDAGLPAMAVHYQTGKRAQDRAIADLRDGKLRALVYVNLLSEGVDMPFLRWMALRRPSPTRVRFVQEIGRGLRSATGKDHCLYLDPNALFASYALQYEEALGWIEEPEPTEDEEERKLRRIRDGDLFDVAARTLDGRLVTPLPPADAYARRLLFVFQAAGTVRTRKIPSGAWRALDPTAEQIRRLGIALNQAALWKMPDQVRHDVETLLNRREHVLRRGSATDLIDALRAFWRGGWPEGATVDPLKRDQPLTVRHHDSRVYFGNAYVKSNGVFAWVLSRGSQEFESRTMRTDRPGREAFRALGEHRNVGRVHTDDAWLHERARDRFNLELVERDANPARAIAWQKLREAYPEINTRARRRRGSG